MALPDTDKVVATLMDLQDAVQSVAEFELRCMLVFDDNDAMDQLKGLKRWPAAVIQYEGMRAASDPGATSKIGSSVVLIASILVINQQETLIRTDTKVPTLLLLTQLRRKLLHRRSPGGHYWGFVVEAAAQTKSNLTFWVQRWQVPLQLQVNG